MKKILFIFILLMPSYSVHASCEYYKNTTTGFEAPTFQGVFTDFKGRYPLGDPATLYDLYDFTGSSGGFMRALGAYGQANEGWQGPLERENCEPQCKDNDQNPPFTFKSSEPSPGLTEAPIQICTDGCYSEIVTGEGGVQLVLGNGLFVAEYKPTSVACDLNKIGVRSASNDESMNFDLTNESIKAFKNKKQCATDSSGAETCVPLLEKGTGSITDAEGRDMKIDPKGKDCGTVNGVFTCIPKTDAGTATIKDDDGKQFTLNNPKPKVNNPTINKASGDSDSSFTTTKNTKTGSTVNNSTNNTGGTGTGTDTGTDTGGGGGGGNSAGIISANKKTTESVNALKASNKAGSDKRLIAINGVKGAIYAGTQEGKKRLIAVNGVKGAIVAGGDATKGAIQSGTATIGTKLDEVKQAVKDSKTAVNLGPTNQHLSDIKEEIKKITSPEDIENPEVMKADENFQGAWEKFQNVPIVTAVSGINLGFSGQSCRSTPVSFKILDKTVSADLSMCELINDAGTQIGLVMMFIYTLIAAFVFLKA